ncbi:XTP/dITP diphosphatase [Aureibacillus halotolerans]|uniref:dITP/XTP pyrophosphatase n=1 Tax=Aureibacillus halotolerans TaxID=1508390 RepID=A0A4R6TYY8_9BACI|nr:XTP/dITP diphosphatase [Aureibacillus halotolerans]TDQ39188.1 XTP/dITP diphosphohydrolase [Aureibacillus halotolerans]
MKTNERKIVIATQNQGKIKEFAALFANTPIKVLSLADVNFNEDIEETGVTFEENAEIKAEAVMKATGLPAVADDSGLAVDALDGAPGVYSARYAGLEKNDQANNQKLLTALQGETQRGAVFVCVLALCVPGEATQFFRGELRGVIAEEEQGTNGFGYDPLFYLPDREKTTAELQPDEKNKLSHRALALQKLAAFWAQR